MHLMEDNLRSSVAKLLVEVSSRLNFIVTDHMCKLSVNYRGRSGDIRRDFKRNGKRFDAVDSVWGGGGLSMSPCCLTLC